MSLSLGDHLGGKSQGVFVLISFLELSVLPLNVDLSCDYPTKSCYCRWLPQRPIFLGLIHRCRVGVVFFGPGTNISHTLLVLLGGVPHIVRAIVPSSQLKWLGSRSLVQLFHNQFLFILVCVCYILGCFQCVLFGLSQQFWPQGVCTNINVFKL